MAKTYTKKIITAGSLVIEAVYPRITAADGRRARAAKSKLSTEAQVRMNRIYSWQKLELLLAANFRPGDPVATLTYDDAHLPKTRKEAENRLKAFRQRLNLVRRWKGQAPLLMIWNIEHKHGDGRWHHHCVINSTGDDFAAIRTAWIYGSNVEIRPLEINQHRNYETLARYLAKEGGDKVGQRAWSYTRTCRQPERETFRVEADTELRVPRGGIRLDFAADANPYGHAQVVKYLAPGFSRTRRRARARRRAS